MRYINPCYFLTYLHVFYTFPTIRSITNLQWSQNGDKTFNGKPEYEQRFQQPGHASDVHKRDTTPQAVTAKHDEQEAE